MAPRTDAVLSRRYSSVESPGIFGSQKRERSLLKGFPGHRLRLREEESVSDRHCDAGVVVVCCCLLLIIATFCFPSWFTLKSESFNFDKAASFMEYMENAKNSTKAHIVELFLKSFDALLCGFAVCLISLGITYMDSEKPGQSPPSPVSPIRYRRASGHTIHLAYLMPVLHGIAIVMYKLWWRNVFFKDIPAF